MGKREEKDGQGWGPAEWWQTSPNWHLTFFASATGVGQLSSPLWVLVGKVPYANMANGLYCEAPDINSSRNNDAVCLLWTRRCVCARERDNGSGSGFSMKRPFIGCFAKSFQQNGLFLRGAAPLGESCINDGSKQTRALSGSGTESVCLCRG